MKLYFAGNFPLMNSLEDEKKFRDRILQDCPEYRRLVSYFFEKGIQNILTMKREERNGTERTDCPMAPGEKSA
jgi:hypothetical protein